MSRLRAVTIVGVGDDGCASLTSRAASAVAAAQVLVGGERTLVFFPQFKGIRLALKGNLDEALDRVQLLSNEHHVCILASGDPLFFGIGAKVVARIGADHVSFLPAPSSMQLAFARAGISWDDATFESVHGRGAEGFANRVRSASKVAVLTDGENSPAALATRLIEYGDRAWNAWVCERLAGQGERVRQFTLRELASAHDIDPLNVLLLVRTREWQQPASIPYLHEDEFAKRMPKNGLITKREVRLLSLGALSLRPTSVVWDIGAGSGSVSVEAALLSPRGRVYAIEVDPEGVALCRDNARAHGTDNVRVIEGRAPEVLSNLEAPDAVFVGGSKGSMDAIVGAAFGALRPLGKLVVSAVTLENVAEAYAAFRSRSLTPEVTLVQISRGVPLARYQRYEALNPIHILAVEKPRNPSECT
jgi:precorrin-6B C5,15-methyltransferase / cobalt-precorrin-6B C5,C15-methyltransferase